MNFKNLIPAIPFVLILGASFFSHSCANTKGTPEGGPKDTIPPILVAVNPLPDGKNVPLKLAAAFTFNEYVVVKDQKAITVSPPLEKPIKPKLKGRSVVITSESDLQPNTTYTIDVTGAINDNNENNPFPGYTLVFSTGEVIDSMYITGLVQDCSTLKPMKGATVMLYKDHSDSALFKHRPDAVAKTDDWGFFCIRNIKDTLYRLYAIDDKNSNNIYDPQTEGIAFIDSLIRPVNVVVDGKYELYKFDMKDTLSCRKRKTEYELNMFMGENVKQEIKNKGRIGERTTFVSFYAKNAIVDSVWFRGISPKRVVKQMLGEKDSMLVWVNSRKTQPDTLYLNVKYMKTDTTGVLAPATEEFKLAKPRKSVAQKSAQDKKDTIAQYKTSGPGETFEQYGIEIAFEYPLVRGSMDSLKYEVVNPRQKKEAGSYTWEADSLDMRKFHVKHSGKVQPGYEYILTVPHRMFMDINGFYNDSSVVKVKLPDDDKLSTLNLVIKGTSAKRYIVDLLTDKRDKVLRSYVIESDQTLPFPYLKEGKYSIRITEDANRNGKVDIGDLMERRQPEKVKFYKLSDDNTVLEIPASSEISQDINLIEMFN